MRIPRIRSRVNPLPPHAPSLAWAWDAGDRLHPPRHREVVIGFQIRLPGPASPAWPPIRDRPIGGGRGTEDPTTSAGVAGGTTILNDRKWYASTGATMEKFYTLRPLPYDYRALAPYISEEQLTLHHTKHHQAYVNGANAILERIDRARKEKTDLDVRATAKEMSFNLGGMRLHTLFWQNLAPAGKGGGGLPKGDLAKAVNEEFGDFGRFRKEFSAAAASVEGSGWAAVSYCFRTGRPLIMQVEKHNVNVFPELKILMVLDVWEHAYYLDYRNDRAKYVDAFWNIVNWDEIGKRYAAAVAEVRG